MAQHFDLSAIDTREINSLMELLARSDVEECEIEQGKRSLALRRRARGVLSSAIPSIESGPSSLAEEGDSDGGMVVSSTGVGLFFRAEKRTGEPKVEEGNRVAVGDILGYVEVMGLPHGVPSTADGIVDAFLVEDGHPVEYGQPLVTLRPA
ncbi:MAG TPA: biotin/lipoyl-containing protein [Chloroflexota bacterium]|nr:biotin/lipoyl-containing protein [Chloroflexota bacterium]